MINIYQISGLLALASGFAILYILNKRKKKALENNGKQSKTG